ncbi:MAG TPA: TIGR03435 family protein [Bryobacteraceae bacterium]|nr:TIGR03435 family protein [Bryobacteraceae bacterium]
MSGQAILAVVFGCLLAQSAKTPPTFDVAAIKPSDTANPIGIRRYPGGRFVTSNTSLKLLITWTYDIGDERLIGAPGWLDSARFDIAAKAANEDPTSDELHAMMKSLLADRFKLRVHTETRDLQMYTLDLDKNGPRVHLRAAPLAVNHDPFKMTESGRLSGTSVTAGMLAKVLTGQLGHYVSDNTGFNGFFDFTLEWRPDSAAGGIDADSRASIFTAIREQLGFRLTPGRAPVEVIAIDHVENRPTDN